jgi:MOSC domain-containing protein YiiM
MEVKAVSTNDKGIIHALCTSKVKGIAKKPVDEISLKINHGIEGDAHAGKWHRQVSLLSLSSVNYMKDRGAPVDRGSFGENIIVDGIEVDLLPVGTYLKAGNNVILRVTQIGKECHEMCAIGQTVGECIMPKKGIFCEVIKEGKLHQGESIKVIDEPVS